MRWLCWLGLHDWWPVFWHERADGAKHDIATRCGTFNGALWPSWFVCEKLCLRCGTITPDWKRAKMYERGWRP